MRVEKLVREMSLIPALCGHEQKMAKYLKDLFDALGYETAEDVFGNVIAKVAGKSQDGPTVMVFAHMDQVGFMVRKIDEGGFILLERVGGIPEKVLPGLKVQIQNEKGEMIPGLIGVKAHHATLPEEKYSVERYQDLFVDIGARSKQQVLDLGIDIGAPVVYYPSYDRLQGTRVVATSLDNRCATAVLADMAYRLKETPPETTVYLVGTVQEEYNLRGGMMAARKIKPDIAICVDVALDTHTPDLTGKGDVSMGGGPVIILYNFHGRGTLNGTIPHPGLVRYLKQVADWEKIPIQKEAAIGGLTDLAYVQLEGEGAICVDIGVPARYFHSPVETCDLADVQMTSIFLTAAVTRINKNTIFTR
ncbi:M42 family metallopeptidase [Candidatus Formimonas warabiya]|uniref:M42 family metallopeptidase n=1 Tax=Formimonas warabiya TaxID=1761012 RepID=A0A3G1KQX8_FORW1|nr:M42 family metallopeptidase [Candidatus Formimonas warabiya]ATW24873.1 hypothetical protein DCMF_08910 [Candidatus Formimonas warabiya]